MRVKESRMLYKGKQWAVTKYGIEAIDGRYDIKKSAIKTRHEKFDWSWPRHMGEKNWVDVDDFIDVLQAAMKIHFNEDVGVEDLP